MEFSDWLSAELEKRRWTQADLHRASGISRAVISKIISKTSQPKPETIEQIARAFRMRPEIVFQKAGLLPRSQEKDPLTREGEWLLGQLDEDRRARAVEFIRFLAHQQEGDHVTQRMGNPELGKT